MSHVTDNPWPFFQVDETFARQTNVFIHLFSRTLCNTHTHTQSHTHTHTPHTNGSDTRTTSQYSLSICVFKHVCTYTHMCTYKHACTYVHVCTYIHVWTYIHVCTYIHIYTFEWIFFEYACLQNVWTCVRIHVDINTRVHIHTYIQIWLNSFLIHTSTKFVSMRMYSCGCVYTHKRAHIHIYTNANEFLHGIISGEMGGWGRDPFSRNLMSPTPRRKWYLKTGRRAH